MFTWKRRHRVAALLACSTVVLVAGCGSSGADDQADGQDTVTIRSAITPSGSLTGPFLYAAAHGCYADQHLTVEVSDGKGSLSVAKDVAQGNVEFGQVGSPTVAQGIDDGLPLISVAQEYGRGSYGIIVPEDSPIKSFKDLGGVSIVTSAGSPETIFIPAVLDSLGMNPAGTKVLNVDSAVKGSTYANGQGDALGTSIPFFLPVVSPARPSRAIPFDDASVQFPDYSIVVQPDYLAKHEDVVRRFLAATFECAAKAADDPEGVGQALKDARPTVTDIDVQVEQFKLYQDYVCTPQQAGHPVGWHSPEAWKQGLDVLKRYGGVDGDVSSLDRFFTNRFFEGPDAIQAQMCPTEAP
jgi:ABC-type nitrate/sulfonate/bicarbonate transport system substrate-binding protein